MGDWWFDDTPFRFRAMKAKNRFGDEIEIAETQVGDFKFEAIGTDKETKQAKISWKGKKLLEWGDWK